jgi:hypothetical protein
MATTEHRTWISERLDQLARLRRARPPEGELESMASALDGFHEDVIDEVCTQIEESEPIRGEPKFPLLAKLVNLCRQRASKRPRSSHEWTYMRYLDCKLFDAYAQDQMQHYNRSIGEICEQYPDTARAWVAWKRQIREGTIICVGWCDTCDTMRWIPRRDDEGHTWADPCPECRAKR